MALIKVICGGCGIVYKDAHGNERHALRTPENGAFECDDKQAERLVSLGVAEYADKKEPEPQTDAATNAEPVEESTTGTLDPEQLSDMSLAELKELAAEMDADVKGCKSKADYINAIAAVEVEAGDDELPDLSAVDPE